MLVYILVAPRPLLHPETTAAILGIPNGILGLMDPIITGKSTSYINSTRLVGQPLILLSTSQLCVGPMIGSFGRTFSTKASWSSLLFCHHKRIEPG